jgi:hypothetical protein
MNMNLNWITCKPIGTSKHGGILVLRFYGRPPTSFDPEELDSEDFSESAL